MTSLMERTDGFWLGRLSTAVGLALEAVEHDPKGVRRNLQSTLAEFIASPVPSEELRADLRRYLNCHKTPRRRLI